VMISDCEDAHIFRATNVSNGTGQQTIAHANSANQANHFCTSYAALPQAGACSTGNAKLYDYDSELLKFSATTYFIRLGAGGTPALWSYEVGSATIQELVEGVENLQVLYGMDDNNDDIVDRYVDAKVVNDAGEFIFDPGQGLPMFNGEELLQFAKQASYIALNDYEAQLFQDRTGLSAEDIATYVKALIITRGNEGSIIYTSGKKIAIPCAKATQLSDPTGCGDAYRAGLIHGILNNKDWETTGRIASLLGAIKIAHHGTQNHHFSMAEFQALYLENFNTEL